MPDDVGADDLRDVLRFVYAGSVDVPRGRVESVLRTAAQLEVGDEVFQRCSLDVFSHMIQSIVNMRAHIRVLPTPNQYR